MWARTNDEAKRILSTGAVVEVSLDHDLGYEGKPPEPCPSCDKTGITDDDVCPTCDGDGFLGGDLFYVAGDSEDNGLELVKWMCEQKIFPEWITIHSWNHSGAAAMANLLANHGCRVLVRPFRIDR